MATVDLTIRERIEAQLKTTLATISGVTTVYRWDYRDTGPDATGDILISIDSEPAEEGPIGNPGFTDKTMSWSATVLIRPVETDTHSTSYTINQWAGKIEKAVMAAPTIIEDTTLVRLAIDTRCIGIVDLQSEDEQRAVYLDMAFETKYRHYRNDPYAGPGITKRSVDSSIWGLHAKLESYP